MATFTHEANATQIKFLYPYVTHIWLFHFSLKGPTFPRLYQHETCHNSALEEARCSKSGCKQWLKAVWVSEAHHIPVPVQSQSNPNPNPIPPLLVQLHLQTDYSRKATVSVPQKAASISYGFFLWTLFVSSWSCDDTVGSHCWISSNSAMGSEFEAPIQWLQCLLMLSSVDNSIHYYFCKQRATV